MLDISPEHSPGKKKESFIAARKKVYLGFLVVLIVKDEFLFVFPFPVAVNF